MALNFFEKALSVREETLGDLHMDTVTLLFFVFLSLLFFGKAPSGREEGRRRRRDFNQDLERENTLADRPLDLGLPSDGHGVHSILAGLGATYLTFSKPETLNVI